MIKYDIKYKNIGGAIESKQGETREDDLPIYAISIEQDNSSIQPKNINLENNRNNSLHILKILDYNNHFKIYKNLNYYPFNNNWLNLQEKYKNFSDFDPNKEFYFLYDLKYNEQIGEILNIKFNLNTTGQIDNIVYFDLKNKNPDILKDDWLKLTKTKI